MADERDVRTPDGRTLRLQLAGDPGGPAILVHHGSPGGRVLYHAHAEDAAQRGALLIGFDRPGFGESTRTPAGGSPT
jgi:pimeloyl-ACP methyl ester carboxylesterase